MLELLTISFKDLLNPDFYINNGGLWLLLFIIFAETGLMVGFFLPGDSSDFVDLVILFIMVSICGIVGNTLGYWFGRKSGPFLFHRKDNLLFKKRYLYQAREFYDKHGGEAIVFARFLPIIRTFAPIIAGIVAMDKKKYTFYNVIGCLAWVFAMLFAGHYLYRLLLMKFHFDLKQHLEVLVIGIVVITTFPVIYKIFFGKKKQHPGDPYKTGT
jgi:membrane-associated protein